MNLGQYRTTITRKGVFFQPFNCLGIIIIFDKRILSLNLNFTEKKKSHPVK